MCERTEPHPDRPYTITNEHAATRNMIKYLIQLRSLIARKHRPCGWVVCGCTFVLMRSLSIGHTSRVERVPRVRERAYTHSHKRACICVGSIPHLSRWVVFRVQTHKYGCARVWQHIAHMCMHTHTRARARMHKLYCRMVHTQAQWAVAHLYTTNAWQHNNNKTHSTHILQTSTGAEHTSGRRCCPVNEYIEFCLHPPPLPLPPHTASKPILMVVCCWHRYKYNTAFWCLYTTTVHQCWSEVLGQINIVATLVWLSP